MKADLIGIIEACYRVEQPEEAWLQGCFEAARASLDHGLGYIGHTYDSDFAGMHKVRCMTVVGPSGFDELAASFFSAVPPEIVLEWRARPAGFSDEIPAQKMAQEQARKLGIDLAEAFIANGTDSDGVGCMLAGGVAATRMPAGRRALWARVAAHLTTGLRLQRLLAAGRAPGPDAVIRPGGEVLHAEPAAAVRSARDVLAEACRTIEQARSRKGRAQSELSVSRWRTLVLSRWTLVDTFESDGKRFVLARENQPRTAAGQPLSARERQCLAFLALGHSNKQIAFELGIAASTVGVLLHRAASKLRTRTREDLIAVAQAMSRPSTEVRA
jgi:DNA-binding CsgD family transcriptional regulator